MQPPDTSSENAASTAESYTARAEQYAREEPLKAVGIAFVGGLILTVLPITGLIGTLLRVALTLLRPALLILGAIKLYEEVERRQES